MRYQTAQVVFNFYGIRRQDLAKLASWRTADEENFQEYEDAVDQANIKERRQDAQTFRRSLEQHVEQRMRGCERGDHRVKSRCPNIRNGAGDVRGSPQPKRRAEIVRVAVVKGNFVETDFVIMVDDFQCS